MNSRACIAMHNHPSGDPLPSGDDNAVRRLSTYAGRLFTAGGSGYNKSHALISDLLSLLSGKPIDYCGNSATITAVGLVLEELYPGNDTEIYLIREV